MLFHIFVFFTTALSKIDDDDDDDDDDTNTIHKARLTNCPVALMSKREVK